MKIEPGVEFYILEFTSDGHIVINDESFPFKFDPATQLLTIYNEEINETQIFYLQPAENGSYNLYVKYVGINDTREYKDHPDMYFISPEGYVFEIEFEIKMTRIY
jgi:hypothetical protein